MRGGETVVCFDPRTSHDEGGQQRGQPRRHWPCLYLNGGAEKLPLSSVNPSGPSLEESQEWSLGVA